MSAGEDEDARFTLPKEDDLSRRLREVFDDLYQNEHFYPLILRHAGRVFTPFGFVIMWSMAIGEYVRTRGLPVEALAVQEIAIHRYAKAVIDDEASRTEVLALLRKMGLPSE